MRARSLFVGSCLLVGIAGRVTAQTPFAAGANYIGPALSLATYGSALAFTGNFEHAINDKWGWGVSIGYYSYGDAEFHYSVIPVAGTAAYHFDAHNEKLDPFVGGSVGVIVFNCSISGYSGGCGDLGRSTGILIGFFGGVRYWLNDKVALVGRAGYGVGFLTVGVDFKM